MEQNQIPPALANLPLSRKHTRLVLLTILMILIGVVVVGYFWYQNEQNDLPATTTTTPTTDQFSDWKTYRNLEYGFEMKYPHWWNEREDLGRVVSNFEFFGTTEEGSTSDVFEQILIQAYKSSNQDVEQWIKYFMPTGASYKIDKTKFNTYNIWLVKNNNSIFSDFIVLNNNGIIIVAPSYEGRDKIVDQIFSTFKFISTSIATKVDTSNWKIYKNTESGFEFKYPVEYEIKERNGLIDLIYGDNVLMMLFRADFLQEFPDFKQFAIAQADAACDADGSPVSVYCDSIKEVSEIKINQLNGYKIFLNEITENYELNSKSQKIRGPIYGFEVSKQTNNLSRGLFVNYYGLFKQIDILDQILSTFKFTK